MSDRDNTNTHASASSAWVPYDPSRFDGAPLSEAAKLLQLTEKEVLAGVAKGLYSGSEVSSPNGTQIRVALPSLEVALDQAKASVDSVAAQGATLDTKASFILGSASVLTAAATSLQGALSTHKGTYHVLCAHQGRHCLVITATDVGHPLGIVAGLAYLVIVGAAWKAYALRKYAIIDPLPIAAFITYPEGEGKRAVLHGLLKTYKQNIQANTAKARWTGIALALFLVEAILLFGMLLLLSLT